MKAKILVFILPALILTTIYLADAAAAEEGPSDRIRKSGWRFVFSRY
jgi:hypothetical protein